MVGIECNKALVALVKEAVKDFRLTRIATQTERKPGSLYIDSETPEYDEDPQDLVQVQVFDGFIPSADKIDRISPFVTVRPVSAVVSNGGTQLKISIIVGTFSRDQDGYHDTLNVVDRIVTRIMQIPDNILDGRYNLVDNITWELTDDQDEPFFYVTMNTSWSMLSTFHEDSISKEYL